MGATSRLTASCLSLLSALAVASAGAQQFEAVGACRDGVPNGAYELYQADGRLRVVGAFAQGKKTGTFIFWTNDGARVGVIPYDDDVRKGTIALWYTTRGNGRELRPKSEAPYMDGKLQGIKRSWHLSGAPRLEARYDRDALLGAQAWTEAGLPLADAEARTLAAREQAADEQVYESLDALVLGHPPGCR